jgi:hypothetical protein
VTLLFGGDFRVAGQVAHGPEYRAFAALFCSAPGMDNSLAMQALEGAVGVVKFLYAVV